MRVVTPGRQGERGIILIAVLFAVAIMSVLSVALVSLVRSGISGEQLEGMRLASRYALRSGIARAQALILSQSPEQRAVLDGTPVTLSLGEGRTAVLRIRDVAGLADLNRSDPQVLAAAAQAARLTGADAGRLVGAVISLRGTAQKPSADANADNSRQTAAAAPLPVVFASTDQLWPLTRLDREQGQALAALLTVFNPTGAINPLAAPKALLASLPGMTAQDLAVIARGKSSRRWKSDAAFLQLMQRSKGLLAVNEPMVFSVEVTLEDGEGLLRGASAQAVLLLTPRETRPFRTLAVSEP